MRNATPGRADEALVSVPKHLEPNLADQWWREYQTTVVYGNVRACTWWPPDPQFGLPGVLVAPGEEDARQFLGKVRSGQVEACAPSASSLN